MEPQVKVYLLDEEGARFFGEGPCRLLRLLEQTPGVGKAEVRAGQ